MALNAVSSTNNAPEPKMLEFGPATLVTPEEAMDMDPSRWAKVKMPHIKERGMGGMETGMAMATDGQSQSAF